jgi:hypothetical protein
MHAHRCKNCAAQGISTVWIHGEEFKGNTAAHKCPKCGQLEWEKWLVPVGSLPAQGHAQHGAITVVSLEQLLTALMYCAYIIVGIFLVSVLLDKYISRRKAGLK